MQGTNTVSVFVMCGTGSDYEAKRQNGISHFLEHMFFKGTTRRPAPDMLRRELDQMGSISNAFTGHETTGYYIKAGSLYLEHVLDILADIYVNSLLAEQEIEREKQVVIEELHLDHDTPMLYVGRMWEKLLYGDQPAGWDIGGDEETVRSFKRADFVEYFNHQYVAENTAVVVAGNFDEAVTVKRIEALFGHIRTFAPHQKPELVEGQTKPELLFEERKTDQTHLLVGFRGIDAFDRERYALDLLATILGGSMSSRMFSRVREELGLAYAVSTDSENYSNRGYLVTYAGVAHPNVEKTITAILEEYRRILTDGVGEDELRRTKDFVKGRTLMALETSNAVASSIGGEEMLTGKPLTVEEIFAMMEAVTTADITRVAGRVMTPDRLNGVLLGPAPDEHRVTAMLNSFS